MGNANDIRQAVEQELGHDPLIDAAGVTVRNLGASVALTGTVPSRRRRAGRGSRQPQGAAVGRGHAVMAVIDQLEITG